MLSPETRPLASEESIAPRLGLRANAAQFALLMLVNTFVGGMIGLERTVIPLIGIEEFGLLLNTAVVSFIISFGLVKAAVNLVSGVLADHYGRKRILVLGWLAGLPVPFMIIWASDWSWIVAANILLGINQGLTWSMAVVMKIDLVGPRGRGLAVGLNEFTGYLAVGLTALATGYLASTYGLRPGPSIWASGMPLWACCCRGPWSARPTATPGRQPPVHQPPPLPPTLTHSAAFSPAPAEAIARSSRHARPAW